VSIRSPIIAVVSECAAMVFSAERIIIGFGLPTKYAHAIPFAAALGARSPCRSGP
jgi:hypothetical protein